MNEEHQPATKKCPFCAEEINIEAVKCKHCGEWLDKRPQDTLSPQLTIQQSSNTQPIWQLVLLSVLTFGIYEIYWFYRNWKHLKIHKNLDISPGWRMVGLLIPVVSIILVYGLFRDIRDYALQKGCKTYSSPGGLSWGYIFLNVISYRLSTYSGDLFNPVELLTITVVVSLLSVWLLTIVQGTLNKFWTIEQPERGMKSKFSDGEIVLLVVGGIFWIFYLIGTFIPMDLNKNNLMFLGF